MPQPLRSQYQHQAFQLEMLRYQALCSNPPWITASVNQFYEQLHSNLLSGLESGARMVACGNPWQGPYCQTAYPAASQSQLAPANPFSQVSARGPCAPQAQANQPPAQFNPSEAQFQALYPSHQTQQLPIPSQPDCSTFYPVNPTLYSAHPVQYPCNTTSYSKYASHQTPYQYPTPYPTYPTLHPPNYQPQPHPQPSLSTSMPLYQPWRPTKQAQALWLPTLTNVNAGKRKRGEEDLMMHDAKKPRE